jgi:hypothetical protein
LESFEHEDYRRSKKLVVSFGYRKLAELPFAEIWNMTAKQWEKYLCEHEAEMLKQNEQDRKPCKSFFDAFGDAWIRSIQDPLGRLAVVSACVFEILEVLNFCI